MAATLEERSALRARLQSLEDELIVAGKRNVIVDSAAGVFTWLLRGAGGEAVETLPLIDRIQELEDLILAEDLNHLLEMTEHGTFTWRLRTAGLQR